ncbi:ABC transporter permease [Halobacillus shinanisalinarum]|uniref:ABC transporter permease n=1 Tax=Halobacillus shinanisalinarum TaxID=2932258 RepID=A0ABY4GVI9_9BACI|nr:ABC transporter permease [Halobacillus shinanisalinarum]UOQ92123.1 ABC transporter permease [Halobacillus shinanisalinarum]
MSRRLYSKSMALSRFIVRQDRVRIPVWLVALSVFTFSVALSFTKLYATKHDREAIAETMVNPAMTAMVGQGYGLDNYTFGAMMAHQMLLMTAVVVGIMSILLVTRHTRAEEEDGRVEMIRSLPAGRLANLNATIFILFGTNALLALLIGFGLYGLGIESMGLEGSLLYGAALGATGFFFATITALSAQLSKSSRGATGLSFAVLGLAYLMRAIGDVGNETLSWLSPLGWVLGAEVYVNNYWWPILLTVGVAAALAVLALYLNAIRDLGAGFFPSRPGRKYATAFLRSPLGLALRLQRTGLIAWGIGIFMIGASYGSVLGDLESFFANIDMMEDLLTPVKGISLTEQFIPMLMSILSIISTIPALMVMFKLKVEEKKNRTEHLLGRAVSRKRLMGSYFILSIFVGIVMLSLAAIGLGVVGGSVMDDAIGFSTFYSAAMVYLPAMWIMIGFAGLFVGMEPKLTGLTWLYLIFSFIVVYMGSLFQFPDWVSKLSPFGHIPRLPIEDMNFMKATILTIFAVILTILAFMGYNKRDIQG